MADIDVVLYSHSIGRKCLAEICELIRINTYKLTLTAGKMYDVRVYSMVTLN